MTDMKLKLAKTGMYVSAVAMTLSLMGGMDGCSDRNGDDFKKKLNAKTICPAVVRVSQLEQEMKALDSSKYLLVEYDSMAERRKRLQTEYETFMSDPANKAIYRQYTHPEYVKIPNQEARSVMKYGFASFALGLASLLGCAAYITRKENQ